MDQKFSAEFRKIPSRQSKRNVCKWRNFSFRLQPGAIFFFSSDWFSGISTREAPSFGAAADSRILTLVPARRWNSFVIFSDFRSPEDPPDYGHNFQSEKCGSSVAAIKRFAKFRRLRIAFDLRRCIPFAFSRKNGPKTSFKVDEWFTTVSILLND